MSDPDFTVIRMFAGTYFTSGSSRILKSLNMGSILLPVTTTDAPNQGDKQFSIGKSDKGVLFAKNLILRS